MPLSAPRLRAVAGAARAGGLGRRPSCTSRRSTCTCWPCSSPRRRRRRCCTSRPSPPPRCRTTAVHLSFVLAAIVQTAAVGLTLQARQERAARRRAGRLERRARGSARPADVRAGAAVVRRAREVVVVGRHARGGAVRRPRGRVVDGGLVAAGAADAPLVPGRHDVLVARDAAAQLDLAGRPRAVPGDSREVELGVLLRVRGSSRRRSSSPSCGSGRTSSSCC